MKILVTLRSLAYSMTSSAKSVPLTVAVSAPNCSASLRFWMAWARSSRERLACAFVSTKRAIQSARRALAIRCVDLTRLAEDGLEDTQTKRRSAVAQVWVMALSLR